MEKGKATNKSSETIVNKGFEPISGENYSVSKQIMENVEILVKEEEEIEEIITSENPLDEIGKLLDNIIAGESENKKAIFLLLLSGKILDPELKQMVLIKGTEGGGKSTLMKIADLFETKDVGRFSEHALDYSDLQGYEILRLKEIGKMDQEKQGVSTLKFLSSDDKGYTVEITVRDKKTGKFTTMQYTIPPITVITSTTRITLDPQFERRAWIFNVDESEKQTEEVLKLKAKRQKEKDLKKLGLLLETSEERSYRILRSLVKSLKPVDVILTFPESLREVFDKSILRVRGDYDKIKALIIFYHFLLQRKLRKININGRTVIFTEPKYAIDILKIVQDPLTSMMTKLEKRTRELIKWLKEFNVTSSGDVIDKEKRDKLAVSLRKSEKSIRRYLEQWVNAGYVSKSYVKVGKSKREVLNHTLLYDLDVIERKISSVLDISKMSAFLYERMKKEAEKYLNDILDKISSMDGMLDLKQDILSVKEVLSTSSIEPETKDFTEKKEKISDKPEMAVTSSFPSEIKQKLYNYIKKFSPTLDQTVEYIRLLGLQGEAKYKLLDTVIEEYKIRQIEDKVGNVHFIVSLESGKELLKNEKLMLSVMSNGEKAGFKAWQWGDLEIKGKEMGLTEEEVNKALEGLKKKGWITDFIKNNVTYFKLLKATSKPSFNKNIGENRSL